MVTSSVQLIDANSISQEGFELSNQQIIPNEIIPSSFTPQQDLVEFWVYDINNNLLSGEENFINYILTPNPPTFVGGEIQPGTTSKLELNPSQDTINAGFDTGQLSTVYNFITYKLGTSLDVKYYVSEISSDRTELRLNTNFIENEVIQSEYTSFNSELESNVYFDEFYLNFGSNQYQVCVNSQLDTSAEQYSILIKLYDALPSNFNLMDEVSVVVKPAESIAYNVTHPTLDLGLGDVTFIKGPNTNLRINEFLNNSTGLQSNNDLLNTPSTASTNNLSNVLNRKGITLTPNYSYDTFSEFVNFSSAKKRIENFIEKVTQIQSYEADITLVNTITGSTSQSFQVLSTISSSADSIETLIKNFDGYEYYLYYASGSSAYPKTPPPSKVGGINSTTITGTSDITLATNVTNNLTGMGSLSLSPIELLSAGSPLFAVTITITSGTLASVSSTITTGDFTVGDQFTVAGSDINASFGGSLTVTITDNLLIPPITGGVSTQPYQLLPVTDVEVSEWLGSDVENSQYYGGISLSASLFDYQNEHGLIHYTRIY